MNTTIHSSFLPHSDPKASDVVQEPMEQPYGLRDCAFRDPSGNLVRVQESA